MTVTLKREGKVIWEYKDVRTVELDGYRLVVTMPSAEKVVSIHDANKHGWTITIT